MNLLRAGLISAVILLAQSSAISSARALEPLPVPAGPVILVVDGKIAVHNMADGKAAFDLAMLKALPHSGFKTTTIWTDGVQDFEGVAVADLLARLGSDGTEINTTAANDYEIRFPITDASLNGGLIAYRANGKELPVNNKGPLWIVFPYDSNTNLQSERFQNNSIWNLETITVY